MVISEKTKEHLKHEHQEKKYEGVHITEGEMVIINLKILTVFFTTNAFALYGESCNIVIKRNLSFDRSS